MRSFAEGSTARRGGGSTSALVVRGAGQQRLLGRNNVMVWAAVQRTRESESASAVNISGSAAWASGPMTPGPLAPMQISVRGPAEVSGTNNCLVWRVVSGRV